MKHYSWIAIVTLALFCLCSAASAATPKGNVSPELAGFTPTLSLSIVLREPYSLKGESTMSATVTLDGPDKDKKDYAVTVSGPAETNAKFTLTLAGEAGSNSKNISVNLPSKLGTATYTATLDDHPDVNDSDKTEVFDFEVKVTKSDAAPNPAALNEPVRVELDADLSESSRVSELKWTWARGAMYYRKTEADEWGGAVADGETLFANQESSSAFFYSSFAVEGRYKIEALVTASFKYNGKPMTRPGKAYIQ